MIRQQLCKTFTNRVFARKPQVGTDIRLPLLCAGLTDLNVKEIFMVELVMI